MKKDRKEIRVRLAPSPTGWLHLGTARTGLFNYLFAKRYGGKFILRIEDTDVQRCQPEYEKDILESLLWLGLKWDEGPYRQSERKEIYKKYIQKILDSGQAFWCYHTKEELEAEKKEQIKRGEGPRHICEYKLKTKNEKLKTTTQNPKLKGIIRFKCPAKKIKFNDLIRGPIEFDTSLLGDFSVAKDLDRPLYNLAVVIDDAEMKISHVLRGEDMLANTPKQILLYQALGLPQPEFAHITITLGPDKAKLSKRHGAVAIHQYREMGYLPEALINFMVLLGWNPGDEREIFSLKELEKEFSIERMGKSAAVFNLERLDYLNGYYIRQMNLNGLTRKCIPYLEKSKLIKETPNSEFKIINTGQIVGFDHIKKIVALEQERMKKLSEIGEITEFFFQDKLDYQPELLKWKKMSFEQVKDNLDILEKILSKLKRTDFRAKKLKSILMPLAQKRGSGQVLWPLRVALTGRSASPGPFEVAEILGKERVLKRIKEARTLLSGILLSGRPFRPT